jgi:3-hydroxyisobutyrate dehydrogenase-like beta-hydroxyacid dehydrogenase
VLDALAETAIAPAVQSKRSNIDLGQYPPRFKLRLAAKDMRLVTEAADVAGLELDAARATRAWLDRAVDRGAGDLDYGAVVAVILGEKPR